MTQPRFLSSASALLAAGLLAACSDIPPAAYFNRGDPENLLDVSTETVTVPLVTSDGIRQLQEALAHETPGRALLSCPAAETLCTRAKALLDEKNIPAEYAPEGASVMLLYDRVAARDCENRYLDNSVNPYNLNYATLGCSVSANTVQMVSDKRQFVEPALLDPVDAEKAAQAYQRYQQPRDPATDRDPLSDPLISRHSVTGL